MVFELDKNSSIAAHYLAELRDVELQKDRLRFRKNLQRLGQILAYECSKSLVYEVHKVNTPLGEKQTVKLHDQPVLISILRAGIPFFQGVIDFFDQAESGFVGAWRMEESDKDNMDPEVQLNYMAVPSIEGRDIILIDPMLATGNSLKLAADKLLSHGTPRSFHVMAVIASARGVQSIQQHLGENARLWIGSIDQELDHRAYIVPGLGDAGDLSFGPKL